MDTSQTPKHPLAEIFGFPANNLSPDADGYRKHKLCPFNNKVPNCTKDKAENPLGVCSVFDGTSVVVTCPKGWNLARLEKENGCGSRQQLF